MALLGVLAGGAVVPITNTPSVGLAVAGGVGPFLVLESLPPPLPPPPPCPFLAKSWVWRVLI